MLDVNLRKRGRLALVVLAPSVAACGGAPSQDVLGSFFPSWMLCVLGGLAATIVLRQLFVLGGLDRGLPAPIVVYLATTVLFSFAWWLTWLA